MKRRSTSSSSPPRFAGRLNASLLIFLAGFALMIVLVSNFYLIPAFIKAKDATHEGRARIKATSLLVMLLMLLILIVGLGLSYRRSRRLRARTPTPSRTQYVDAWAEAGKRVAVPSHDDDENEFPKD